MPAADDEPPSAHGAPESEAGGDRLAVPAGDTGR